MAMKPRYLGEWSRSRDDCMLCEMQKKTHWYIETPQFVVAEKLSGGPFIVLKDHKKTIDSDEEWAAQHLSEVVFGEDIELDVRMGMVPDHWHAHIIESDDDRAALANE